MEENLEFQILSKEACSKINNVLINDVPIYFLQQSSIIRPVSTIDYKVATLSFEYNHSDDLVILNIDATLDDRRHVSKITFTRQRIDELFTDCCRQGYCISDHPELKIEIEDAIYKMIRDCAKRDLYVFKDRFEKLDSGFGVVINSKTFDPLGKFPSLSIKLPEDWRTNKVNLILEGLTDFSSNSLDITSGTDCELTYVFENRKVSFVCNTDHMTYEDGVCQINAYFKNLSIISDLEIEKLRSIYTFIPLRNIDISTRFSNIEDEEKVLENDNKTNNCNIVLRFSNID